MKNFSAVIMTVILAFSLAACSGSQTEEEQNVQEEVQEEAQDGEEKQTADTYEFQCVEGEPETIENLIFEEDVTVNGEKGQIAFLNCEFKGNVTLTAKEGTQVILGNSTVAGQCIFQNDTKEATMEWSFPKFLIDSSMEIATSDCIGAVIAMGDFDIVVDGQTYTMADSELYFDISDPESGFVPYTGQEANYFCVAQWWENGEKTIMTECEYDPNM